MIAFCFVIRMFLLVRHIVAVVFWYTQDLKDIWLAAINGRSKPGISLPGRRVGQIDMADVFGAGKQAAYTPKNLPKSSQTVQGPPPPLYPTHFNPILTLYGPYTDPIRTLCGHIRAFANLNGIYSDLYHPLYDSYPHFLHLIPTFTPNTDLIRNPYRPCMAGRRTQISGFTTSSRWQ